MPARVNALMGLARGIVTIRSPFVIVTSLPWRSSRARTSARPLDGIMKPRYRGFMSEVVTTIRLPPEIHEKLRRRAFAERRPIAAVVRDAIRLLLEGPPAGKLPPLEEDPLWQAIGTGRGGPRDEALEHDHYLYETPKKYRSRRRRSG